VDGRKSQGLEWPQHDPWAEIHVGNRTRRFRRGRASCPERLCAPRDADRFREPPHLQLSDFPEVLDFWFGAPDSRERGRPRKLWFQKSETFDDGIRLRFLPLWERAARAELDPWQSTPLASVALIIALDQFPRNMFRGTARAFSTDPQALAAAAAAVERGFDRLLSRTERTFMYLPFEHAEDLAAQRRSLALFEALDPKDIDYVRRHHEIIARFGRFPHRNAILGRESTPDEIEFLKQPGSSF
jgi:uncharacterized protein (DUF924 family)